MHTALTLDNLSSSSQNNIAELFLYAMSLSPIKNKVVFH